MDGGEEILRYDAPSLMFFLRPGIGEEKMSHRGRAGRQQIFYRVRSLQQQNAHIVDGLSGCPSTSGVDATEHPLDAEKISIRKFRRHGNEKKSVATPQVDFQRRRPRKNRRHVEWRKVVCRDQFDRCRRTQSILLVE